MHIHTVCTTQQWNVEERNEGMLQELKTGHSIHIFAQTHTNTRTNVVNLGVLYTTLKMTKTSSFKFVGSHDEVKQTHNETRVPRQGKKTSCINIFALSSSDWLHHRNSWLVIPSAKTLNKRSREKIVDTRKL